MLVVRLLSLLGPVTAQFGPGGETTAAAAPSPTNSIGCHFYDGEWECAAERTATPVAANPSKPSPTGKHCQWHDTHWDCEDDSRSGECVIHAGHTHGHCTEEDLACGQVLLQSYNMPLHIGAVFIILVTSAVGTGVPIVTAWTKGPLAGAKLDASSFGRQVGIAGNILFLARHFGTGIILSTAFVHLLYHGFLMFNNKCLGELVYESTAPAIALAAALVSFWFDFFWSPRGKAQTHYLAPDEEQPNQKAHGPDVSHPCGHVPADAFFRQAQDWQVLLLEAGILFHSIMIGVTLGSGSGNGWTTLLIVIVFHQFFEGAALGSRIALLYWISKARAATMGIAYVLITPIGVAMGIGVRRSFSHNGKASLLAIGILNSISAGILLYTSFRLLSADFTEGPLRHARWSSVTAALLAMLVGLIAMSVLGKWA